LSNDEFVEVMDFDDITEGSMKLASAAGRVILLAKIGGTVFGVSNSCPHMGCSLANGTLNGYLVTCPCHGWSFDIRNGQYTEVEEITLTSYECKIQAGKICIRIIDDL
jgi:nitrite reductase/ring-hydroxylating ferredoxin subunit